MPRLRHQNHQIRLPVHCVMYADGIGAMAVRTNIVDDLAVRKMIRHNAMLIYASGFVTPRMSYRGPDGRVTDGEAPFSFSESAGSTRPTIARPNETM